MGGAGEVTGPGPGSPQAGVGKSGGGGGEGHAGRVATERLECGSQARRPAPSAGMGSAARAGAARALEEARRAAKETVFLWAAFWVGHVLLPSAFGNTSGDEGHARLERSSRQRGKRCPSLVARHGYGKTGTLPRNKWATIRHGPPARHDALETGLGNLDLLLRRDRPAGAGRSASASARWRARASISFCSSPPPPPAPPSPPPPGGLRGNRHLP
ncbi:unnamed protein product [Prorocentrum cordatum]|uniref:Uncharacterized protein n=1 Tax=Prorocentrum cordatum TaxID=2364126 RepID=A0ABN9R2W9_9DINO|nr:unnamed protein product [Polarella glacialis]